MKKIFTKLFLLTTLLMVSSQVWAQDYWSVLNDPAPRTIGWGEEQTFSFNLVGPAEWIRFELDSYGSMDLTVYGYRESNPAARVPIIEVSRAEEGVFQYDIKGQGFSRIEIKVKARGGTAKLLNVMAGSPFYTYESDLGSAEYNSADASTSFTIDYYGTPNFTSTYLYDDWDNDMFPVSISASGGKATVTVKYLHNEVGEDHKAFIIISNGVFKHPYKFTGTTTKANQTITWTPPTEMTVGDSHTLSATAPGGAVSYEVTGNAVTRSGNTLTAVKAGTVTITASQAGNGNYNPAPSVTKEITIKKATPTVSAWPTIAPVTYGTNLGAALVLKGGSASVAGTFVITDAYTAATKPNAGTYTYSVKFRPTETNKYYVVSGGTATLTVNKANQAITWTATPPTEMTVGDTHTLSATATSGDAVAFAISGDAATLAGNTLTAVKAGTVTITASQAGNGNYNAAANVTHTITVNKATPTVTAWPTIAAVTYGASLEQALVLVGGTASVEGTFVITSSYTAATVPNAGTHTYSVEFRPTESNKYNNVAGGTATLTVNKADQVIAWTATPPTEMTVGDSHTLSATAPGGAVAYAISGEAAKLAGNTLTAVQAGTVTITASQAGNSNYNAAANVTHTITINKATPTVTAWPTLDAVTYGATLEQALVLVGGEASVAGTFVITDSYNAADMPNAGAHTYGVEFRPTESNKYNNVAGGTATLTVNKAGQAIAWTATPPTEMTVGDSHTLSATALGGAVAFAITGDAAKLADNTLTAIQAGTVTITASQAGNSNYNPAANVTHSITINKATPTVTAWPTIAPVTYGTNLAAALILKGGSASVAGTFVITSSYTAATVPNAGTHTYSVEFRPTESNKYNNVSGGTATLVVNKADQAIVWTATPPTEMTVGDSRTLSATALGGAVAFAITGDAATLADNTLTAVQAGTVTITASQAGNSNYNAAANVTHTITINKATPTVTAWPTLNAVTYGAKLEQALVLVGGTASVEGTFVITDSYNAADVPNAGTHTYNLEFRPTESNKYNVVSGGTATLTVNKADQVIAWTATPPTEMTVGDSHTLSATAPGGAVAFALTGDAATLAGNTLTAVQAGTVTITASQAGNSNYNAAANVTHTITINKATPTVTAWPTLDAVTYGAKLEQALVLVGGTASVEGTFVITDAYTAATVPNAGAHTYSVEFRPTESIKYNVVSGGTATLTVNKADQVIAWTATPPTEMTVGDSHTLSATALGGTVAFAITGDAATLADNTLTAVQAGTVTITASQAGNSNYNAAANVTHTITINKTTPTVTAWPTLDTVTYGATLEQALVLVGGTASVEGTFVITDSYNAATVPNAGTHTYNLEFRPTESNKYNNVSGGTATLTVNKADQVIVWTATPPTEMTVGDSHTLSATALGGAVAYAVTGDAATLADNTLTAVQAGTVTITASQAGNGNYNAAANVTHTITINKATPTVTAWPTLDTVTYGATLEQALVLVGGTASVEGTFVITDSYNAADVPNAGAHTYSVEYRPTESNKYNNVSGGTATLTVNKADQAIAWTATPPTEMTVGDSHTLSATALGGAVAFAITGDAATLADNTLTAVQAGTVTITASQAGNGNYNAAANVTHTITINKATPTVTAWPTLDAVTYGATLEQALVLVGGTASVEGTFVITDTYTATTVPNAGAHTYNLEFRPTESNKYNNVSGGTATLTVNKADQVIAWTATPPTEMTVGDSHTLSATALGGAVAFAITGDAATLADNTLTAVQAGTVTITASQAGNGNYNAAANVTHTITINKATPTVTAWPTLNAVTYGATLEQALVLVGGEASVAGTFVITDAYTAATVPNAGAHTYSVEFRPTESNKFNNVSGGTATLTINQATPSVAWPTFAEVTYGTPLRDALQLVGGNANVEGAFHISGEYNEEEVPVVGTYKYAVWFNPTDYTNYTSLYKDDVTLTVNKANQTITWDFADCTLLPGQTLELNATATCGAMTYLVSGDAISVSGTTLTAVAEGTASIKATHAGNENYNAIESPEYTITVSASGYTRTVTNGNYGTICLPYGSSNYSGADFYEIAYAEIKNGDAIGLYLDQIEEGAALVAGKPYIFKATADILIVTYEGAIVDAPVAGDAGLTGTLVDIPANDVLVGNYIIAQNMFWDASAENYLNANHAYINKTILLQTEPKSLVPGRRRVSMGETSGNVATDVENSQLPMINSQKLIENGLLIIIRDGVKYNAHGQKL